MNARLKSLVLLGITYKCLTSSLLWCLITCFDALSSATCRKGNNFFFLRHVFPSKPWHKSTHLYDLNVTHLCDFNDLHFNPVHIPGLALWVRNLERRTCEVHKLLRIMMNDFEKHWRSWQFIVLRMAPCVTCMPSLPATHHLISLGPEGECHITSRVSCHVIFATACHNSAVLRLWWFL